MDRTVARKDDRAVRRPRVASGESALREVLGGSLELLNRRDEHVCDHVQRKRHHVVPDVVRQVAAAEPAVPFWHSGLLEKDKKRAQVGAAWRKVSDGWHGAKPSKQHLQGPKRQHRFNRHPPERVVTLRDARGSGRR